MRKKLAPLVGNDSVELAGVLGVNVSGLAEQAITGSIGDLTYMHVRNDIVQAEIDPAQNGTILENGVDVRAGRRAGFAMTIWKCIPRFRRIYGSTSWP